MSFSGHSFQSTEGFERSGEKRVRVSEEQEDGEKKVVHRRSKTGCLVCRARRIKCDLGQPECAKCIKYGAECGYPEKKPLDLKAINQSLHKRHKPTQQALPPTPDSPRIALKPSTSVSPVAGPSSNVQQGGMTTTMPKFYDDGPSSLDALHALCRMTKMGSFFSAPVAPPDWLREQFTDPDDLRCFHHCMTYSFSIFVVKEEPNPWLEHIPPLLFSSDPTITLSRAALRLAVLTVGATHLAYLHNRVEPQRDPHFENLSSRYRTETLRLLRRARCIHQELFSNTFLAASLLINHNDCLASEKTWKEAWRLSKDAVVARGGCEAMLFGYSGDVRRIGVVEKMLIEQMAFIDLFASLSIGEPPFLLNPALPWWERLQREVQTRGQEDSVEDTKGIQREIIRLSSRVAKIAAHQRVMGSHRLVNENRQGPIPHTVTDHISTSPLGLNLQMVVVAHNDDVNVLAQDANRWFEGFRMNRMMTVEPRVRIGSLCFWHMCQIIIKHELQNHPREEMAVQEHAKAILELCVEAGDKIEYLNWPLIIACWVLQDQALREQGRGILKLFAYQCCNEVVVIRDVIEEVWKRMDEGRDRTACHYLEVMMDTGKAVLLA